MSTEKVIFRLIRMPCCGYNLCWINPRWPAYCPECGSLVLGKLKDCVLVIDEAALLELNAPG